MKLTKEERNGLYYVMLAEAQTNIDFLSENKGLLPFTHTFGFCEIYEKLLWGKSISVDIEDLKELVKQKPRIQSDVCYWFPPRTLEGWKSRVELLKKAILWTNS